MKSEIRKLIDLPFSTAKGLMLLASQDGDGMPVKLFIQKVLIEYERKVNHPKSANYKALNPFPKAKK